MAEHERDDQNCGLCIGGPRDGKWICCSGPWMTATVLEDDISYHVPGEFNQTKRIRHVDYRFKPVHFDDGRKIGMWIVDGLSAYDAMNTMASVYLNLVGKTEIDGEQYHAITELIDKYAPQTNGYMKSELRHQIITNWLPGVVAKALSRGASRREELK